MADSDNAINPSRRRRTSAEAHAEILDAAERFLEEHSWHDLTIEEVMGRTTMTRNAFYHYFTDRQALFLHLMQRTGVELATMTDRWLKGHNTLYENSRAALEGISNVYARHGRLIRASAEAATVDIGVAQLRTAMIENFIALTDAWITTQIATGELPTHDPGTTTREIATALITLNDSYLRQRYGNDSNAPTQPAVETLLHIWIGTLFRMGPTELRDRDRHTGP